jgi:uncharacterized repeat protein (TIGR03803 family)
MRGGVNDNGTVFKTTPGGALVTLFSFGGTNGLFPFGGLLLGRDGNFYGTTIGIGRTNYGSVFKMTPAGELTTLFFFQGTNGSNPYGRLVQGSDGNFYGTTLRGGDFGLGTVFTMTSSGVLTTLISFSGTNGAHPHPGLVAGDSGTFYGVTVFGGSDFTGPLTGNDNFTGNGIVFAINTNGVLTTLVSFDITNGRRPWAALTRGSDGSFYGTTSHGGTHGVGTIFRITPAGLLTTLVSFGPTGSGFPQGGVTQGSDGHFYGTTSYAITNSGPANGTVFKWTTNGVLTTLVNLNGTNGMHPFTDLVLASDGNLYGAMADATLNASVNGGTFFRIVQPPVITGITLSKGNTTLSWSSFSNGYYRVERNSSLAAANWTPRLPTVTANGSSSSFTEPLDGTGGYFYRVILLP